MILIRLGLRALVLAICCCAMPAGTPQGQLKPETERDFDCYVQAAEARMDARQPFLLANSDTALNDQLVRGRKVQTVAPNGANPHKVAGGQLYDWIGSVFIPGARLDRLVAMLQDYDHRAQYFPETISASKLLCRTGQNRFRYSMRLKEPAVIDTENNVVWERVDPHRWRCRSYSTHAEEAGKDHGYLRRLYSYWRFAEVEGGVYVEGQTITLSDEFGGMARAFGSMLLGINPEKSLKHSLESMRESILKPGLGIPDLPAGLPECGEAPRAAECAAAK
ncbi:MAG: hypothetical protein C5B51_26235 [Terriglobia bacterium]|nr:MAG: hypothetical protein C5B51_26235 [Terriglobia bacterium]